MHNVLAGPTASAITVDGFLVVLLGGVMLLSGIQLRFSPEGRRRAFRLALATSTIGAVLFTLGIVGMPNG